MSIVREINDMRRFWRTPQSERRIVFYSEHSDYYPYFEGIIQELVQCHSESLLYVSSDINDPILRNENQFITSFYINRLLPFFCAFVNCKILVMTMTDLHTFHIKRSLFPVHYVYVFHSLVSTHMMYLEGAFDHYDTILCAGKHHIGEIRRREYLNDLPRKNLIPAGYYRLERIYHNYLKFREDYSIDGGKITVLVAPSWGENNILESIGVKLVETLLASGYKVVVRPHPETLRRTPHIVERLERQFGGDRDFLLELSIAGDESLLRADVLICDLSGVALEYALGTERPVLFIDGPIKVRCLNYEELGIQPLELAYREKIGVVLNRENLTSLPMFVSRLIENRRMFRTNIREVRNKSVFHFEKSSEVGAKYIIDLIQDRGKLSD